MSHDDIRQRLAAVEELNWSRVEHETQQEYYSDWVKIGPLRMHLIADRADEDEVVAFLQHAATDLRCLIDERDADQQARTRRESIVSNPIYGKPPEPDRGEPARFLADAVEVLRPNGEVAVMDLVALADAAVNAERAVAGLREENEQLCRKVATLEEKVSRIERAGRILAGGGDE
ncbi:hypothetical protein [Streptomyces sp.]|uniref:hypothetical protein n=1 Tax=Streptomyces sp. TaxID=1931 RepID=UPI002F94CDC0